MSPTTTFEFSKISARDRYKILIGTVVPRPIAWVTTTSLDGCHNAAPYSFFNCLSADPALVALGIETRPSGASKDTAQNIRDTGVFTVNIISHELMNSMNITAVPFEKDIDEIEESGLSIRSGQLVASPSIAESPAALECKLHSFLDIGNSREIVLGEIIAVTLRSDIVNDRFHIDPVLLDAVGRMGGHSYSTTRDLFELKTMNLKEYSEKKK